MYHNPKKGTKMKDAYTTGNSTCIPEIKLTKISKRLPFPNHHLFTIYIKFGRVFCNSQTLKFPKSSKAARLRKHQVLCSFECFLITFDWEPMQVHSLCSSYLNHQEWQVWNGQMKALKNDILSPNHQIFWIISDRIQYQCDYNRYTVYVYIMCIYI